MPRAIWKGTISFGLVTIPVGLFSAVAPRELSFHLIDSRDLSPVRNKRVNEATGEEVPWEVIVKGYEFEDGRRVTLTDAEIASANVKATRTIDVLGAVCASDVAPEFLDTPYFLAPEQAGNKAYALLREALRASGRIAVAQIVIRSRQRLCALIPEGDAILLEVLRYPYELRESAALDLPGSDLAELGVTDAELALARQLVATIESDWDPAAYHDTYHDDLLDLIRRKSEGETVTVDEPEPEPMGEVVDIMELLKRSVEDARVARGGSRAVAE
ncbi:MAG: Ku protein [Coriobacteriia bacterium]|nr:Ku protein [Coriobacteriia bacterium]